MDAKLRTYTFVDEHDFWLAGDVVDAYEASPDEVLVPITVNSIKSTVLRVVPLDVLRPVPEYSLVAA